MTTKRDISTTKPVTKSAVKPAVKQMPVKSAVVAAPAKPKVAPVAKVQEIPLPVVVLSDIPVGTKFKIGDGNIYQKIAPVMVFNTGKTQYGANRIVIDPNRGPIVSGGMVMPGDQSVELI